MFKPSLDFIVKNCTNTRLEQESKCRKTDLYISKIFYFIISIFPSSRDKNHVTKLLSRYPNLDRKLLQREYPDVNIRQLEFNDRARGHFAPKID